MKVRLTLDFYTGEELVLKGFQTPLLEFESVSQLTEELKDIPTLLGTRDCIPHLEQGYAHNTVVLCVNVEYEKRAQIRDLIKETLLPPS